MEWNDPFRTLCFIQWSSSGKGSGWSCKEPGEDGRQLACSRGCLCDVAGSPTRGTMTMRKRPPEKGAAAPGRRGCGRSRRKNPWGRWLTRWRWMPRTGTVLSEWRISKLLLSLSDEWNVLGKVTPSRPSSTLFHSNLFSHFCGHCRHLIRLDSQTDLDIQTPLLLSLPHSHPLHTPQLKCFIL